MNLVFDGNEPGIKRSGIVTVHSFSFLSLPANSPQPVFRRFPPVALTTSKYTETVRIPSACCIELDLLIDDFTFVNVVDLGGWHIQHRCCP